MDTHVLSFWDWLYFFVFFCAKMSKTVNAALRQAEGLPLKIAKVLNNNIVIAVNDRGEDVIAMGCGIAFGKKHGDVLEQAKVERLFTNSVPELSGRFEELVKSIPAEYIEAAEKVIAMAKMHLGKELADNLYLTLADHVYFTIQRYHSGMLIRNRLLLETRMLYPDEFRAGQEAVRYLDERFRVDLPEDEAAFMALHFVNASMGMQMNETMQITEIVQEVSSIIRNYFHLEFDPDSLDYFRMVTHIKFFAQRIVTGTSLTSDESDLQLYEMVRQKYGQSFACVQKIVEYLEKQYRTAVSGTEQMYLTIHVERVRRSMQEKRKEKSL